MTTHSPITCPTCGSRKVVETRTENRFVCMHCEGQFDRVPARASAPEPAPSGEAPPPIVPALPSQPPRATVEPTHKGQRDPPIGESVALAGLWLLLIVGVVLALGFVTTRLSRSSVSVEDKRQIEAGGTHEGTDDTSDAEEAEELRMFLAEIEQERDELKLAAEELEREIQDLRTPDLAGVVLNARGNLIELDTGRVDGVVEGTRLFVGREEDRLVRAEAALSATVVYVAESRSIARMDVTGRWARPVRTGDRYWMPGMPFTPAGGD